MEKGKRFDGDLKKPSWKPPNIFIMTNFKHTGKLEELSSEHLCTHHLCSTKRILLYLVYLGSIHLSMHQPILFFGCISKKVAEVGALHRWGAF